MCNLWFEILAVQDALYFFSALSLPILSPPSHSPSFPLSSFLLPFLLSSPSLLLLPSPPSADKTQIVQPQSYLSTCDLESMCRNTLKACFHRVVNHSIDTATLSRNLLSDLRSVVLPAREKWMQKTVLCLLYCCCSHLGCLVV